MQGLLQFHRKCSIKTANDGLKQARYSLQPLTTVHARVRLSPLPEGAMSFDIRDHLEQLEPNPQESGKFFCPACGGHNLSINLSTGAYNCWADDSEQHRALIRENLSPSQLLTSQAPAGHRVWTYRTMEGRQAARVERHDFGDQRPKQIRRHQQASLMLDVTPLYWAEAIRRHSETGGPVFLVEGEDCCDVLRGLDLNAITLIGGSSAYKKELYYDLLFQIRDDLVLVPDMDKPGVKLMNAIASDFPEARWCYVQGPNYHHWAQHRLPESGGYDIADAVRQGAGVSRIQSWIHRRQSFALTGKALEADLEVNTILAGLLQVYTDTLDLAVRELKVAQYLKASGLKDLGWSIQRAMKHCASEQLHQGLVEVVDSLDLLRMATKRPRWIIPGFLPAASVILLGASGGTGKTSLCFQLAKHVALGQRWSELPVNAGKVLIISTDESGHDTKEKLQTIDYASVPRGGVSFIRFWRMNQTDLLEEKIRQLEPSLVIIDSLTSVTAGLGMDRISSNAGDCLYELRDMAERHECSFLILHHLSKNDEFRDSTTYVDNVSEAWKLTRDDKDSRGEICYLDYVKSRSGFQGRAKFHRVLEGYSWTLVDRQNGSCSWELEQRLARWIDQHLQIDGVEHWLDANGIQNRAQGFTAAEINSALPVLRLTGRVACDTAIVAGRTFRRFAALGSSPVASQPSNVVSLPAMEAVVDDYDELLCQIREGFVQEVPAQEMLSMLQSYPWPERGREQFWGLLDEELRQWLMAA